MICHYISQLTFLNFTAKNFDTASHFDTDASLSTRAFNRPRTKDLANKMADYVDDETIAVAI